MFNFDEPLPEDYAESSGPKRRGRRKKATSKEFKLDTESKNRIRRMPAILDFYRFVRKFSLREEAYKFIVLSRLGEEEARKIRKLLMQKVFGKPASKTAD